MDDECDNVFIHSLAWLIKHGVMLVLLVSVSGSVMPRNMGTSIQQDISVSIDMLKFCSVLDIVTRLHLPISPIPTPLGCGAGQGSARRDGEGV